MSLLSRLNFKPLAISKASEFPAVCVAIQPPRADRPTSAARLDISFSRALGKQIGIGDAGLKTAIYTDGQFIALCMPDVGRKLFGVATKEYRVGAKSEKAEQSALHFASTLPPTCVTTKCSAQAPKRYEVENGVLIVELPDSFIRPEYLTGTEVAVAVNQRDLNPPLAPPWALSPCSLSRRSSPAFSAFRRTVALFRVLPRPKLRKRRRPRMKR